jgi:hypothetical protein
MYNIPLISHGTEPASWIEVIGLCIGVPFIALCIIVGFFTLARAVFL